MDYLQKLNPRQLEAAKTTEGPLLILAGAGSGKTATVISRIAYILSVKAVRPYEILALTFTNKAAGEMRDRIASYGVIGSGDIWMGTFHSICARILRMHCETIGYTRYFSIYDETDTKKAVTEAMASVGFSDKSLNADAISSLISKAKENYVLPGNYANMFSDGYRSDMVAKVYERYQSILKRNNAMDFDDLLLNTLIMFNTVPDVAEYYRNRFKYITVDEYQDTNRIQYEIVSIIAGKHKNLCVCGDDDQSIYGWRGADIRNILDFEKDFPDAKVVRLEQNYRSTSVILEAANEVIKHNESRMGKNLWTNAGEGEKIRRINTSNDIEEADFIAHEVEKMHREGDNYSDIALLYRVNAQSRSLEEGFIRAGVPYVIVGGTRFYDRAEVKDILSYLKFASNPSDELSFIRAIGTPRRGFGPAALEKVFSYSEFKGEGVLSVIREADTIPSLSRMQAEKLKVFAALIDKIIITAETKGLKDAVTAAVEDSGYMEFLDTSADEKKENRKENLKELVSAAGDFANTSEEVTLAAFLENVALVTATDTLTDGEGSVKLMTMHNSKGLEFETVILPGMEEGYFPLSRAAASPTELEEERRLCYVAITRAKKKLMITTAQYRRVYGTGDYRIPSRFIDEIPFELIEEEDSASFRTPKNIFEQENIFNDYDPKRTVSAISPIKSAKPKLYSPVKKPAAKKAAANESFAAGDRLLHPTWGEGTVIAATEAGGDTILTAAFAGLGIKKFILGVADIKKL